MQLISQTKQYGVKTNEILQRLKQRVELILKKVHDRRMQLKFLNRIEMI